jgi:hypothetical protein
VPTLVESAPALRTGGYVIDFWGLGYDIAERMGLAGGRQREGGANRAANVFWFLCEFETKTRLFMEPIFCFGVALVMARKEWTLDLYKLLLGALLFGSPWMFSFVSEPAKIDAWVVGLVIVAIAAATLVAFDDRQEWALLAVATWMIACPWLDRPSGRVSCDLRALADPLRTLPLLIGKGSWSLGRARPGATCEVWKLLESGVGRFTRGDFLGSRVHRIVGRQPHSRMECS